MMKKKGDYEQSIERCVDAAYVEELKNVSTPIAENARREMFGEERFRAVISRTRKMDSKEIIANILDEVHEFCGEYPQSDDITLMVVRVV